MRSKPSISVIIPVHNGQIILLKTLHSLQNQDYPIHQIFTVDDRSTDNSIKTIEEFKKETRLKLTLIKHKKNRGLAWCYNDALRSIKTTHVILLMQDCILVHKDGVRKLIEPFIRKPEVVCTCSQTIHPFRVWRRYNFWQKCLMSRHVDKVHSGRNNSCCCYSVSALKIIGLFYEKTYRTAGEDADVFNRIGKIGKIVDVDVLVEHRHTLDPHFSLKDFIRKENQRAEAVGATLLVNRQRNFIQILQIFARPTMIFGLLIPSTKTIYILIIILYSYFYTQKVYGTEWKNPKIIILPFINCYLLVSWIFYFFRGAFSRRQKL